MNLCCRRGCTAAAMLLVIGAVTLPVARAQTPQEQDAARRLQQNDPNEERLRMNDAARRMQQNDPAGQPMGSGQRQGGGYPGGSPQMAGRARTQVDANAATAGAEWVPLSGYGDPALALYAARSTIRRSGNLVRMWDGYDFKTPRVFGGKQVMSLKNQMEYDCRSARSRLLSTTGFSDHMGKGSIVASESISSPVWEPIARGGGSPAEALAKVACAGK